jgi:DNA-directed RNA polymerase subunit RPC12/RpoP
MIVKCSQCGAKIKLEKAKRFFTCTHCRSSLILERDRTFQCFFLEHHRSDSWATGSLAARLAQNNIRSIPKDIRIDFRYFPVWHITFRDGTTKTQPAAKTIHTEISSVKIPAGDLKYFEEGIFPDEKASAPTIEPETASLWTRDEGDKGDVERLWLVYLPIYFIDFALDGTVHHASLIGESTRIYSDTLPAVGGAGVDYRPFIFFAFAFGIFITLGILFPSPLIKVIVIGTAAIVFILISKWVIRRGENS